MSSSRENIKKMAELLKSGATMLSTICPKCNSPLFKLRSGEIVCPNCGARVFLVKDESESSEVMVRAAIERLERTASQKLVSIGSELRSSETIEGLDRLIKWLDALERIERIKKHLGSRRSE